EISVEADRFYWPGIYYSIKRRDEAELPGTLNDPLRSLSQTAGAVPESDFTGQFGVRGGGPDQNLFVLEGIAVPNPYRLRMILGAGEGLLNPVLLEDMKLQVSGFSGEFGNFLSSVLQADLADARPEGAGGRISIDMLEAGLSIQGPAGKGSWSAAFRRSHIDLVAGLLDGQTTFPKFHDSQVKTVFPLTDRQTLVFFGLHSRENVSTDIGEDDFGIREHSSVSLGVLSWVYRVDRSTETVTAGLFSENMDYNLFQHIDHERGLIDNRSRTLVVREKFQHHFQSGHSVQRGFGITIQEPDLLFESEAKEYAFARREVLPSLQFDRRIRQVEMFGELNSEWTPRIATSIGIRYDLSSMHSEGAFSPRASIQYILNPNWTFYFYSGIHHQFLNPGALVERERPVLYSFDPDSLRPERAGHLAAGLRTGLAGMMIKIEGYYKKLDRLILPEGMGSFYPVNSGSGYSRGIEVEIGNRKPFLSGIYAELHYAYGKAAYRQAPGNDWILFRFDRRHSLSANLSFRLSPAWQVSAVYRFGSGLPYNIVEGTYHWAHSSGSWRFYQTSDRPSLFPDYHRLDLRMEYSAPFKGGRLRCYLEVLNATNRQNLYEILWYDEMMSDPDEADVTRDTVTRHPLTMLPILPWFGVEYEF
ncbi:TonB-dependent receptor, partial [bacterium]|nr:TonB-dependent receptor [bacterium]